MRALAGSFFALVFALSGCASIPISTALSLSSLTPRSLAQVAPEQVRVRLSVPVGYELNVPKTQLSLRLTGPTETRTVAMNLTLLGVETESRSAGLLSASVPVTTYSLALSDIGARDLRELQKFVLSGDTRDFKFTVRAPLARVPPGAREVTFWADLKLSLSERFMPLINGAKISLDPSLTGG